MEKLTNEPTYWGDVLFVVHKKCENIRLCLDMRNTNCTIERTRFPRTTLNNLKEKGMPSQQQKSAKNGPEMYLLIGINPILVILKFDDGRSLDLENVRRWFFLKNFRLAPS